MKTLRVLIVGLAMATMITGCFKVNPASSNKSGSTTSASTDTSGSNPVDAAGQPTAFTVIPGTPTAQVLNFRAVQPTFLRVTKQTAPSAAAAALFNSDFATYSLNGAPDSVTSTMLFNFAKVGAEVCLSLVNKEKALAAASRSFFGSIDFTKTPQTQAAGSFSATLNSASREICGHDISSALEPVLETALLAAVPNTVQGTADAAEIVCTAYIASSCTTVNN